jgi:hypothetical protein
MFKLVLFDKIGATGERVAILSEGEDPEEYCSAGFRVQEILELEGDADHLPINRLLEAS